MAISTPDLQKVFEVNNLKRAWDRVNTSEQIDYKNYFRHLYNAYGLSIDSNLKDLRTRLRTFKYDPCHSTKIYLPKKTGLLRVFTLLCVEDQIVYQAFCNIIAIRLYSKSAPYYNQYNFSYYFAGERSSFFYKSWKTGYNRFKKELKNEFNSGKIYKASFDYASFYDTIDHNVLCHLLEDLGFTREFCQEFTKLLKVWTCTDVQDIKYHSHGIPQGPAASGVVGEVLLNFVDRSYGSRPRDSRYLRYADDITILSNNESSVKHAITTLDLISKKLGIFPQANKTKINKVENIEEELNEISTINEDSMSILVRKNLAKKANSLIRNNTVINETQFKYYLNRSTTDLLLEAKCIKVLGNQPHLHEPILYYLSKRATWTKNTSDNILKFISKNVYYDEVNFKCLQLAFTKIHKTTKDKYVDYCVNYLKIINNCTSPNLKSQIFVWLLRAGLMKYSDLKQALTDHEEWVIHNIIDKIDVNQYGKPSYDVIINELLSSESTDISIFAAYIAIKEDIEINYLFKINHLAQFPLLAVGKIATARRRPSTISTSLAKILEIKCPECDWRKFLGEYHDKAEGQIFICRSYYSRNDATALVNLLDAFNDILLHIIYTNEASLGIYTLGTVGGILNSDTCRLAKKYRKMYDLFSNIHNLRRDSDLSHAFNKINKTTKTPTRRIAFAEIRKLKAIMISGYLDVIDFTEKTIKSKKPSKAILSITPISPSASASL